MLIIDLDDTLLDHTGAQRLATEQYGAAHALEIPDYCQAEFVTRWQRCAELYFPQFVAGELSFLDQATARIRAVFCQPDMSERKAQNLFEQYLDFYQAAWSAFADMIPFLESHALAGRKE